MASATIICSNCGREVTEEGIRFCPNCGAWLGAARPAHPEEEREEEVPSPAVQPAPPDIPAPQSPPSDGHNPWEASVPPPSPALAAPPPTTEGTITRNSGTDSVLGFIAVLLLNLALPSGLRQLIADAAPALGSGIVIYLASIGLYLFVFRERYPDFARGWRAGLVTLLVLLVAGILLTILVLLGLLAICSGMFGRNH